jgi:TolB-like protein/DNA-binding winged helix-turn-helix (wHTH) protein/cytochrome c-type biogenesis protein CcmH/NrfG
MGGQSRIYEFGPFVLETAKRRLLRCGEPVALAPKVLETLLALIENRERVVSKDELLKHLWGDASVEEGGLTRNISILRKTLGEKPDDHQYVVTVPGRGYQFVAELREARADPYSGRAFSGAGLQGQRKAFAGSVVGVGLLVSGLVLLGVAAYGLRPVRATRPEITSLAVLPLDNLSDDPAQEYFADGMTESLIANLARIRALRVVSRTSVMRFKQTKRPLSEIARELNVDAIVEGSVQRTGDGVKISTQLIHAPTDTHLWAREYERRLTDILKLQSEVARAVASEIRAQVTAEERARMASAGTVNPEAHQAYLLGQYHLWKLTEEHLAQAVEHFERATQIDPDYAAAHSGLSHAWWWRGIWGKKTLREVEAASRAAALKALELDPRLAEAHVSMGRIKYHEWDWAGAEQAFGRALELDPNSVDAHFFHGMLFMALGRFPEAVAHMHKAQQLDPLSATVQSGLGRVLYRARRFEEAIAHLKQAIALEPNSPGGYGRLADVYESMGRYDEALALAEKSADRFNQPRGRSVKIARIYARMGKRKEARQIVDALPETGNNEFELAGVYAALGEKDEAFRLLFKKREQRPTLNYAKTDPSFEPLHTDPRWPMLLRQMNLSMDENHADSIQ